MRFAISAFTFAAAFAVGIQGADLPDDIPGYEALPLPNENKYAAESSLAARSVETPGKDVPIPGFVPLYAAGNLEPTHMPEEDLHPTALHARSEDVPSESFVDELPDIEGTEDDHLQRLMARSLLEDDEPTVPFEYDDDSPDHSHEIYARALDDLEKNYPDWDLDAPYEGTGRLHARSLEYEEDEYEDAEHDTLHARSVPEEEYDDYYPYTPETDAESNTLHARSLDEVNDWESFDTEEALAAHFAKRSEDEYDDVVDSVHPGHNLDVEKRSFSDKDFAAMNDDDDSEYAEFEHAGHNLDVEKRSFSDKDFEAMNDDDDSEYAEFEHAAVTSSSPAPAIPAAAPTPKPTSADTVSSPTPTTASQWSDVISETAASASSTLSKLLGRSVHSHPRFHHHYTAQAATGGPAASSTPASSSTGAKGLFKFLW